MSRKSDSEPLLLALEQATGPALVLDRELTIVGATDTAAALFGGPIPLRKKAPQVLCGQQEKRPLAEALARGEAVVAEIARPSGDSERTIAVRSLPLYKDDELRGHLLLMTDVGESTRGVTEDHGILTASDSMRTLLRNMRKVANSDASILVRGETGAGKELVAKALHAMSPRRDKPFAAINCAALPAQLLESELFGHVRGAFTGAVRENQGHFRRADGGTLFLDEVGELPLEVQAKLLRVTQERTVLPVGGTTPIPVDVRLVSATHRSLRQAVTDGRFRADLMFRLRVVPLFLPPLRDRPNDIPPLVHKFIATLNETSRERKVERVSDGAMAVLRKHGWPGNVRELQNVLQYAFLLGDGPVLSEGELPDEVRDSATASSASLGNLTDLSPEARRIARALERASGSRARAAQTLGISRSTLWRKMKEFDLNPNALPDVNRS